MKWFFVALIVAGVLLLSATYYPIVKQEITYRPQTTQDITPQDSTLGIVIPKIGANSRIVENVDPFNSTAYQQALTQGVAHAKGTVLPGDQGNSFLFSHSSVDFLQASKYNSVFYLLSKLEPNDPIYIYRNGQKLEYEVTNKKIVAADAVTYLQSETTSPTLTLMTCWPPGTDMNRLIIHANIQTDR